MWVQQQSVRGNKKAAAAAAAFHHCQSVPLLNQSHEGDKKKRK